MLVLPRSVAALAVPLILDARARFAGVLLLESEGDTGAADAVAWSAPFPDRGHRAGLQAFAAMPGAQPLALPEGMALLCLHGGAHSADMALQAVEYFSPS